MVSVQRRRVRRRGAAAVAAAAFLLGTGLARPQVAGAVAPGALYFSSQGTGVARAYCPGRSVVLGGGGFVEQPSRVFQEEKLRQSFPISDRTGQIAFGSTAIGWQAASSNFEDIVVAFVVCAGPGLARSIMAVSYVRSQTDVGGAARALCPAGYQLTGGGGLVETPEGAPFEEQSLRYSYPVSDDTGTGAYTTHGIGWQAATSDFDVDPPFDIVVTFAICVQFVPAVVIEYPFTSDIGTSRAFCSAGTTVTGGGVLLDDVLNPPAIVRQSHPISDATGTIAHGSRAVGWQGSSFDFQDQIMTWAICVG